MRLCNACGHSGHSKWLLISSLVMMVGYGCSKGPQLFTATRVARHDLAGSTHVAVLATARWEKYRDALQPDFHLSSADAIAAAIPDTLYMQERVFDALGMKAKGHFVELPDTDENRDN